MLLRRVMSPQELEKFLSGEQLEKYTDFSKQAHTESVGFCFFGMDVPVEKHVRWIPGFRSEDLVCTFECDEDSVRKSWGQYEEEGPRIVEYCTTQYSNKNFRLVGSEPITKYGKFVSREAEARREARKLEASIRPKCRI